MYILYMMSVYFSSSKEWILMENKERAILDYPFRTDGTRILVADSHQSR